jgi:hypothetical protein
VVEHHRDRREDSQQIDLVQPATHQSRPLHPNRNRTHATIQTAEAYRERQENNQQLVVASSTEAPDMTSRRAAAVDTELGNHPKGRCSPSVDQ